jgi:endonuclease/exonuclease/phosphatase family metal-dependent hydrolase
MIRLLTLNCWKDEGDWPARMAAISEGLAALSPDIVCLQEVYGGGGRDTGAVLAAQTGLFCTHVAARIKARGGIVSSSGLAILSRTPPEASQALDLPTTAEDGGRKALIATFGTEAGPLRVASLHLSHLRTAEAAALRAAQLSALIHHATAAWHGPLVLAGDFNAPWQAPEMAALHAPGWTSSAPALPGQTSLIGRPAALIDHIALYAPSAAPPFWRLGAASVVLDTASARGIMPSDHAGIMVSIAPQNNVTNAPPVAPAGASRHRNDTRPA